MSLLGRFFTGLGSLAIQKSAATANGKVFDASEAAKKAFLPELYVYPSLTGSSQKVDSFMSDLSEKLSSSYDSYLNALGTSASKAQETLIKNQNEFNKLEAQAARRFSETSARAAMTFEKEEAQAARDWSKMMSDTAYQRAAADLKAAGLNPVLAFGSPASSGQAVHATGKVGSTAQASASTSLDPARGKDSDTSMTALVAGLLGSAAKIMSAIS